MTTDAWLTLLAIWGALAVVMAVLWGIQRRTGDAGIVDVAWTLGVGLAAVFLALTGDAPMLRRLALGGLAGIWAARLGTYLVVDRILPGKEDGRYKALRESWGESFQSTLFWFFQLQAFSVAVLAIPFAIVARHTGPVTAFDAAAVALWVVAIGGEAIADGQLARFRKDPANRGKTCRRGLWRYSRHPNYFFEWVHWLSYPLLAWGAPQAWLTLVSPALLLFLVLKVTGIPPTEAQSVRSRGDDYRDYQRTTSAFFPWFPKTASEVSP